MNDPLAASLALPCGVALKNRLAKAALTEGIADARNRPTPDHARLYERWARGGSGLVITGNVQVDRRHLERPGNVVIDGPIDADGRQAFARWVAAGTVGGTALWMQINHPGRQAPARVTPEPVAPSAVPLALPGNAFAPPRALAEREIEDIIARFADVAGRARLLGFTGVQIHAAHGYLFSQFLSPLANRRTDAWGGSLENRARALLETVRAVRRAVGTDFPVSVKLNSADFQKGGFTLDECKTVVGWLDAERIDLLELSGGTYERPRMADNAADARPLGEPASTAAREAFFLTYAREIAAVAQTPIMLTGGFRSRAGMEAALAADGIAVIGLGRPLCVEADFPRRLLARETDRAPTFENSLELGPGLLGRRSRFIAIRSLNGWGIQGWYCLQLVRMGEGRDPDTQMGVLTAFRRYQAHEAAKAQALERDPR